MTESPIAKLLEAVDALDVEAIGALMTEDCDLLTVDGRRAHGAAAACALLSDFLTSVRSTAHRVIAHWHEHDVWIAEVEATYVLEDWLRIEHVPRAFIVHARDGRLSEVHVYGARELPLSQHQDSDPGMVIGGRWVPPL